MSRHCPNCDQRLLADEQVCWQCGAQLQPQTDSAPVTTAAGSARKWRSDPLVIYGAITGFVILVALLLTAYLGRLPRSQLTVGNPPDGWVIAGDQPHPFALFLPEDWSLHVEEDAALRTALRQHDFYGRALSPLMDYVEDEEVVLLATGAQPTTFLIVGRSPRLNRLSTGDAATLARADDEPVLDSRQLESQGAPQAEFRIELETDDSGPLQCRQRFLRGLDAAFIFSLCTSSTGLQEEAADTILSSIRLTQ